MPSGEFCLVNPYHVSMKGIEKNVLCRDDEDYGIMVKYIAVCSLRKNVIVIIYTIASNHCHVAVLAKNHSDANAFSEELKREYSQWFQSKYLEKRVLRNTDVQALLLDSDWYVRNALAYIPRNAIDNGESVSRYKWSGYRAMFAQKDIPPSGIPVCKMSRREQDRVMHTRENLKKVPWLIDSGGDIIPESFCDSEYLEQVFNGDPAFWLKTIGSLNPAEMQEKLVDGPRRMLPDSEFFKLVNDISRQWFKCGISELPDEKKYRLLLYVKRSRKTTVHQLARVFGIDRERVGKALAVKRWG